MTYKEILTEFADTSHYWMPAPHRIQIFTSELNGVKTISVRCTASNGREYHETFVDDGPGVEEESCKRMVYKLLIFGMLEKK